MNCQQQKKWWKFLAAALYLCPAIVLAFLFGTVVDNLTTATTTTSYVSQEERVKTSLITKNKNAKEHMQTQQEVIIDNQTVAVIREATIPDPLSLLEFDKCSASSEQRHATDNNKRPEEEWMKPMWVPSYAGSGATSVAKAGDGSGNIGVKLINAITGLKTGAKNYHASRKNGVLRRCRSTLDETAACTNSHPLVPIGPEKQAQNFHPNVLLFVRNFKLAFPANYNDRQIAYHDWRGQVEEENWRQARDELLEKAFEEWKTLITEWRQITMKKKKNGHYYRIGMYVPYERLLHPETGPALTSRLAGQFQQAGFAVRPESEIGCTWYETVKEEWHRLGSFYKYVPGYTAEQKEFILRELDPSGRRFQVVVTMMIPTSLTF